MESLSDSIKIFDDRLSNLSNKVNSYNTNLEEKIGQVQKRTLGSQSREEISKELTACTSECIKKFDEIYEKLEHKEIPEEEIKKLSKQIVQMGKTIQSFQNSLVTNDCSSLKLDWELEHKHHQLIDSFLKSYIKLSLVYSNNPKEIISQCSISTFKHVVRTYFQDFSKKTNNTVNLDDNNNYINYIFILNPEDREDKILMYFCE